MPSESDLRDLLQGPDPEGRAAIDLDAVLTRARRRRRPKVVAAQALGSVALVGVLVTAVGFSLPRPAEESATIAQDTAGGAETQSQPFFDEDARKVGDQCGLPLEPTATAPWTLDLVVASADSTQVTATATQTIDDQDFLGGRHSTIEALTVSRDGVVVGSAVVGDITTQLDPAPGYAMSWEGRFDVLSCDGMPLAPGTYDLRPVIEVMYAPGDIEPTTEMLYGEPVAIQIG